MSDLCAACGLPGHRYGRNEGIERFDPIACINQLRAELAAVAHRVAEADEIWWCEEHDTVGVETLCDYYTPADYCRMVRRSLLKPE